MPKTLRVVRSDGAATRTRILESAGKLFAENGFAQTPNKMVAERAGVDLASINYHFGSRDGLYQAVLVEAHRRFMRYEEISVIVASERTPEQKLHALLATLAGRIIDDAPWNMTVLAREMLAPSDHLSQLFRDEVAPKIDLVLGVLSEITGIPVDAPELMCCLISFGAVCHADHLSRKSFPDQPHHPPDDGDRACRTSLSFHDGRPFRCQR
jgi:AcrR family transcriptional regulator